MNDFILDWAMKKYGDHYIVGKNIKLIMNDFYKNVLSQRLDAPNLQETALMFDMFILGHINITNPEGEFNNEYLNSTQENT